MTAVQSKVSLRRGLAALSMIAIGFLLLAWLIRHSPLGPELSDLPAYILCWFGGGAAIGAGIGHFFKRAWRGALYGIVIQFLNILVCSLLGLG